MKELHQFLILSLKVYHNIPLKLYFRDWLLLVAATPTETTFAQQRWSASYVTSKLLKFPSSKDRADDHICPGNGLDWWRDLEKEWKTAGTTLCREGCQSCRSRVQIVTRSWALILIEFLVWAELSGSFHLTGGWVEEVYGDTSGVLAWNPVAENWQLVGNLINAR